MTKTRHAIILFVWLVVAAVPAALAQTVTLEPIQDTWINGLASTTPHGSDTRLSICPVAQYWIYLQFDLHGLQGAVEDAQLRMTRFDGSRPEEISLYFIPDDQWTETTLTGAQRPSPQSPMTSEALGVGTDKGTYDAWHLSTLAEVVQREIQDDGILTLMLREDPTTAIDVRSYFSREGARTPAERPYLYLSLANLGGAEENLDANWDVADVGVGVKSAFDFGPDDRIHVMGMTEETGGQVWYASAETIHGPWNPVPVAIGYFYGPGDLRAATNGSVHIVWHDHDAQNPDHYEVTPSGSIVRHIIETPDSHDGWDNALAFGPDGSLHQSSVFPNAFGAMDCLQYGVFDGRAWRYTRNLPGSGTFMYGLNTSIAVDNRGNPHIVYCQSITWTDPADLKYAVRIDGVWQISTVVTGGVRGRFPTIALDHWDRPHVAWLDIDSHDPTRATVRYGVLNSGQWEIEDVDTLQNVELGFSEARKSTSIVLDETWRPHIAYADKHFLRYAYKPFDTWQYTTVLESSEDLYKGLVVMRLDSNQQPALTFWQRSETDVGLIRMARLRADAPVRDWLMHEPHR